MADDINYQNLLGIKNPEDVATAVRQWASNLSDQEHMIRSTIQEIHLNVERRLKYILYEQMKPLIFWNNADDGEDGKRKKFEKLERTIYKMGFQQVHRLLEPCLSTFPADELGDINAINEVRNQSTHANIDKVDFKGGNPFKTPETLARLFLDAWAVGKQLDSFHERMIDDPLESHKALYKAYKEKTGESFA